jgi:D-serine deaminase-like pyridoxal phosphate-dependent protein
MTEATGVSDILNPPAPTTPEAAAQRLAELDASPDFLARVKSGDTAAFQERGKL